MGIIIIPLVITIILAIVLKKDLLPNYTIPIVTTLGFFAIILISVLLTAGGRYYKNRSIVAQYHFNPCGYKAFYMADKMAQHREFHDDWFIGIFYSDSLANLPYPQCE